MGFRSRDLRARVPRTRRGMVAGRCVVGLLIALALSAGTAGCAGDRARLTPPPPALVKACKKLATEKLPADTFLPLVYCPPAVPRGSLEVNYVGAFGRRDPTTYFLDALSPSLPHPYVDSARRKGEGYPPPGHWLVAAWKPPSELRSFLRREGARRVGREQLQGVPATVLLVPPGAAATDSGHAVVLWQLHGIGYTASVHGHVNQGVAKAMARALISEMLRCPSAAASRPGCRLVIPTAVR